MDYIRYEDTITSKFYDIYNANFNAIMAMTKTRTGTNSIEKKKEYETMFLLSTRYATFEKANKEYKPELNYWKEEDDLISIFTSCNFIHGTTISFSTTLVLDEKKEKIISYSQMPMAQTEKLDTLVTKFHRAIINAQYGAEKTEIATLLGITEEEYKEIIEENRKDRQEQLFNKISREEAQEWKAREQELDEEMEKDE